MKLVIVESPTKAKKLKSYLSSEYQIEASVGHIRDLPKSELGIQVENNFEPTYVVSSDKNKVVKKLRELASKATAIYLATDPDREGEAIAWHIKYLLEHAKGKNKTTASFSRSTFHEITKQAVVEAIAHSHAINMNLVDAQQARRVLDRLVGYQVSPVLWKKIRRGLSAGRVQSVALRMVVEREREIEAFIPEEYWEVDVAFSTTVQHSLKSSQVFVDGKPVDNLPEHTFIARVVSVENMPFAPTSESDVLPLKSFLPSASYAVRAVESKERKRASLPPFTTSTLQQASANRLGFSSKQTMRLAQQLYEEGLITYHRTDSFNLSSSAISMARDFITQQFGASYLPGSPRVFAKTSKNAQEAHEAIRVTDASVQGEAILEKSARFDAQHVKLYDLIWRRFVASQMEVARYQQTSITVLAKQGKGSGHSTDSGKVTIAELKTTGSVLTFDGWMKLFPAGDDVLLPELHQDQPVGFIADQYAQKYTQPPARYNDASLVKELEKRGIGRPSTYASIISVLIDRGYVDRQQKRFFATPVGMTVTDFLLEHFPKFMEYDFTAGMEEDLDAIARGEKEWQKVIKLFYTPLSKTIEQVTEKAERMQIPVEHTGESCPLCGETEKGEVVIRTGKFGKFKSCSRYPDCVFTENIVEKVEGVVCPLCRQGEVILKNTRWGKPFFSCSTYPACEWASWKQPQPGEQLTQKEWQMMQAQREERKKKWAERRAGSRATTEESASATKSSSTKKLSSKKSSTKRSLAKKKSSSTKARFDSASSQ